MDSLIPPMTDLFIIWFKSTKSCILLVLKTTFRRELWFLRCFLFTRRGWGQLWGRGVICGLLKQRLGGFFFQTLTSPLCSCLPPIALTAGDHFCPRKTGVKTLLLLTSPERRGGRRVKSWKQYYCGMWTEQKQHFPSWKKKKAARALPSGCSLTLK